MKKQRCDDKWIDGLLQCALSHFLRHPCYSLPWIVIEVSVVLLRYPWRDRLTIVSDPRHVLAPQMQWKVELNLFRRKCCNINIYESIYYNLVSGGFWKLVARNHKKGVYTHTHTHRVNAELVDACFVSGLADQFCRTLQPIYIP